LTVAPVGFRLAFSKGTVVSRTRTPDERRAAARRAAKRRLAALRREEAAIRAAFPELFRKAPAAATGTPQPRPAMSPARRRAMSERMTRYWAARRAGKTA
jgi:hypothetical protein